MNISDQLDLIFQDRYYKLVSKVRRQTEALELLQSKRGVTVIEPLRLAEVGGGKQEPRGCIEWQGHRWVPADQHERAQRDMVQRNDLRAKEQAMLRSMTDARRYLEEWWPEAIPRPHSLTTAIKLLVEHYSILLGQELTRRKVADKLILDDE